jgi:poly-gamma-glutamate synthesis protein (capsule biosynthesis protein)
MRLLFVGDVMLGRLVNHALAQVPPTYPWGDTLPVFAAADLRICNLECCISDRGAPWVRTPKVFHFRSDAKNVAVLQAAALDAVSLANNHVLDYGEEALADTLEILDRAGIAHTGAGRDQVEAARPALVRAGSLRVGMLAFTDNEPPWEATVDTPGIRYVPVDPADPRAQRLFADVAGLRAEVDLVVVSAHWGPNWGYRPQPHHRPFARRLIESGADVVFGHSCHVFQGIELYRGRPIIYSAGDFVDDYAVDEVERNDESFIFVVVTGEATIEGLALYPTVIREFQARLARGGEADRIAAKMRGLCAEMGTTAVWRRDQGVLEIPVP